MTCTGILFNKIKFVADEHDADVLLGGVEQRRQPVLQVLERLSVRDIVHYQAAKSLTIVGDRDRPVFLLTGRVPQLGFDSRAIFHRDVLRGEFHADCRSLRLR